MDLNPCYDWIYKGEGVDRNGIFESFQNVTVKRDYLKGKMGCSASAQGLCLMCYIMQHDAFCNSVV